MEVLLGLMFGVIPIGILVLLVIFISKTNSIALRLKFLESEVNRIRTLEADILELKALLKEPTRGKEPSTAAPVVPVVASPQPSVPRVQVTATSKPLHVDAVMEQGPPGAVAPPPVSRDLPSHTPSHTREEWEAMIGGKLLNRIGALALIIGVGFFLKYAFDNNWITETMRVAIGFVTGGGLLVLAARAHKKDFEVFAQGLVGAGLAVLYLSVYASFSFYHLVPQTIAFVLMSAVTVLAFLQAFKYDSLAVALLGVLGGFLTPFLLSTGEANEVGLFTYLALLDAGILAVLLARDKWVVLEPLALAATWLIYLLWYKEVYNPEALGTTVYYLIVFWLLFYAIDVYRMAKSVGTYIEIRTGIAAANALLFYSALYSVVNPPHHNIMGIVTLLFGLVYLATAIIILRYNSDSIRAFRRQILTAIILIVAATAIEFTGFKTVMWWSLEALVLVLCGVRWNLQYIWASGTVLYALALFKLIFTPEAFATSPVVEHQLLLNQRAFTFALLSASMCMSGSWLGDSVSELRRVVARTLQYVWPVLVFALITVENAGYFEELRIVSLEESSTVSFREVMTLAVLWMAYATLLFRLGSDNNVVQWQHVAIGSALVSVCFALVRGINYQALSEFRFVLNYRVLTMLLVTAGMYLLARGIRAARAFGSANSANSGIAGILIVALLLDVVTGETYDVFEKAKLSIESGTAGYSRLSNLQQLSLSSAWLVFSVLLMGAGIWRRERNLRIVAIVLFGITILKIFIYDLSFLETLYRIFSFIGLGLILLAVSFLYQKYKHIILGSEQMEGRRSM